MYGSYIHGDRCDHQIIECRKKEENEYRLKSGVFQYLQVGNMRTKKQRKWRRNERKPGKCSDLDAKWKKVFV